MPETDEAGSERGNMDVLATGIDAAKGGQGARVFRNQCQTHRKSNPDR
jgi:hypothetical protein